MGIRTDQLLLEQAIRKGFDLDQEQLDKAKKTALELMDHREYRARARGVSLTIAMKAADDRQGRHADRMEQAGSSGPASVTVHGDVSVSVGADVIASVLASRRELAARTSEHIDKKTNEDVSISSLSAADKRLAICSNVAVSGGVGAAGEQGAAAP